MPLSWTADSCIKIRDLEGRETLSNGVDGMHDLPDLDPLIKDVVDQDAVATPLGRIRWRRNETH
jgi:hypothetical protein